MTTGLDDMLANMNAVKDVNTQGLVAAGFLIKGEAQRICPVDTANLINSAYANDVVNESVNVQSVEVGFQASYAPFVHEMPAKTNWQKPTAENKFLEKSLMSNEKKVLQLIANGMPK